MRSRLDQRRLLKKLIKKDERREGIGLNLVSMIDVFTTLVFFLLITSTSVNTLPTPRDFKLPNSISLDLPPDVPVVVVTNSDIELQGKPIMSLADAARISDRDLPPLMAALENAGQVQKISGAADPNATTKGEINIMADQGTQFALLEKVMATCGDSGFARISLAVDRHGKALPK